MSTLVSLCIPTYQRPAQLREALESCLAQTYRSIEILISDDSENDETERMLQTHFAGVGNLRYVHNRPSRGQAGNINILFEISTGERLLLLHDDDLLFPDAVEKLSAAFVATPGLTAAFGKQVIIDIHGREKENESADLNRRYFRTTHYAGIQKSALWSGLVQQFPNDGYMLTRDAALRVRYLESAKDVCDLDFGIRLGAAARMFCYVDSFTAKYRHNDCSLSTQFNPTGLSFNLLNGLTVPPDLESVRRERLIELAPYAVSAFLKSGDIAGAQRVYQSGYYRGHLSFRVLMHFLFFSAPAYLGRVICNTRKPRLLLPLSSTRD